MKKIFPIIILVLLAVLALYFIFHRQQADAPTAPGTDAEYTRQRGGPFTDGLKNPSSTVEYTLDEYGTGIASREVFGIDINQDGNRDRITRDRYENGTAHFYFAYKVELNAPGGFTDITPDDFRTTEGADCSLQKLQFIFKPNFQVIKISREWQDSWTTPTMASRTIYTIQNDMLHAGAPRQLRNICNVSELF